MNLESILLSESDTKGDILYDSMYMKCLDRHIYRDRILNSVCLRLEWVGWEMTRGVVVKKYKASL